MAVDKKFSGSWRNKYGSEMNLEADDTGRVIGKFRTAVGRPETQDIWKDKWFDVIGYTHGDLISLVVNYAPATAMSVISGKLNEEQKIETMSYTRFILPASDAWRETQAASLTYERN